jgi:hypothetical protein
MTDTGASASALRVVVALADDPDWAAGVVEQVSRVVAEEIPELAGEGDLQDAIAASNAESLRLFVDMLVRSVPPEEATLPPAAVAYARELERCGRSPPTRGHR